MAARLGIRVHEQVGTVIDDDGVPAGGRWLRYYDPEAYSGRGEFRVTSIAAEALRFDDAAKALALIRRVPRNRPLRPDGRPNRPLMAFTLSIEPIEV